MSKVLFVSNFFDGTGYAHAASEYLLALDHVGVDVVPRVVHFNGNNEVNKEIERMARKNDKDCDICIQCVLPHDLVCNGNFKKNVAIFFCETSNFIHSGWQDKLNMMDEVWVATHSQEVACLNSGVKTKIRVIPVPCNTEKFEKSYKPLELPDAKDKFLFYNIGEFNHRKNLPALIRAFHTEFAPNEPVGLVIKGGLPGATSQESLSHAEYAINEIKAGLKLYQDLGDYMSEIVITERYTEEQLMRLHATCDCYVCPSYGEGWCMPAFDAMGSGKPIVYTGGLSIEDFCVIEESYSVDSVIEPCIGMLDSFPFLYTGYETWYRIDVLSLMSAMRHMYETRKEDCVYSLSMDKVYEFSYGNIGTKMLENLK